MATMDTIARALQGFGAGYRGQGQEFLSGLDAQRKQAMVKDLYGVKDLLDLQTEEGVGQARALLVNRLESLDKLGGDPSDSLALLELIDKGKLGMASQAAGTFIENAVAQGWVNPRDGSLTAGQREWADLTGNLSPEDQETARRIKLGLDPRAVGSASQTIAQDPSLTSQVAESQAVIKGRGESATQAAKGEGTRRNEAIQIGVDASRGIPLLRRTLTLLDRAKTGGIDKVGMEAKRLFGVSGADETELSANLSRAVLGQLKSIFGAQFTAAEGERLERIEAEIGKSTKGNVRLLRQLLRVAENKAYTAIDADPDDRTNAEILSYIEGDKDLTDEALMSVFGTTPTAAPAPAPTVAPTQPAIRTYNPQTGEFE